MRKPLFGENRLDNLDWLSSRWLADGPPVCFLQGASGVGKTALAQELLAFVARRHDVPAVYYEVADRPTPNVTESLMELALALSDQGRPEMAEVMFEQEEPNPAYALELVMREPIMIVIDEGQRFFRRASGAPLPEMNGIIGYLRNRSRLPGRLLLVSDRMVEASSWSERLPKRTLRKLRRDEAVEALEARLVEAEVELRMPLERRQELARALDFNPRVMETLVGALRYDSIDNLTEERPDLWADSEQSVTPASLWALEEFLVTRTMWRWDRRLQRELRHLAAFRRAVPVEAVAQCDGLLRALHQGGLLTSQGNMVALNPVLRSVALAQLREGGESEFRLAHTQAADYYLHCERVESFAELRHHLVQAGRESELGVMGRRFSAHLGREIKAVTAVPTDGEELAERIAVVSRLLDEGGARGVEYHLARCLRARDGEGDVARALDHAQRALGPGVPEAAWHLLADLTNQTAGADAAVAVVRRGLSELNRDDSPVPLYGLGADVLVADDRLDEAVALLNEGIGAIGPDKNSVSLYQKCAGLLAQGGRMDQAMAVLRSGTTIVPPEKNGYALYQVGAELLARAGQTQPALDMLADGLAIVPNDKGLYALYQTLAEVRCRAGQVDHAIASLREGIARVPAASNGYKLVEAALCLCAGSNDASTLAAILAGTDASAVSPELTAVGEVLQMQMQDDWPAAVKVAAEARKLFPRYLTLAATEALSRLAGADAHAAWRALSSYPNLVLRSAAPQAWLAAVIQLRRWARAEASEALATYFDRPTDGLRELNESFLLSLWDQRVDTPDGHRLCLQYPILPAALTGLEQSVGRVPFSAPVLR